MRSNGDISIGNKKMNYILIFSYKEFLKCKDLFQNEKKCFIVPKELDEKILVENKIVLIIQHCFLWVLMLIREIC